MGWDAGGGGGIDWRRRVGVYLVYEGVDERMINVHYHYYYF